MANTKKQRVLIIEDEKNLARLIRLSQFPKALSRRSQLSCSSMQKRFATALP